MLPTFKTPRLRLCEEPAHILSIATLSVRLCKAVLILDSFWHSLLVLYLYIIVTRRGPLVRPGHPATLAPK